MTDLLEQTLTTLYDDNQPDAAFANQLEQHLRTLHEQKHGSSTLKPMYRGRFMRRLATLAASLLIVFALFATVPPLRSFAQSIVDFFVPGSSYFLPGTEDTYADSISVDTIADAETIAGIDALEWADGGFHIIHIGAAEGYISIAYERDNDRGVLIHVSKWRIGTRREQLPVDPDVEVVDTAVGGLPAQFVAGYWFGEDPEWYPNHYRNLIWQDDTFTYSLQVGAPFANSLEDVIAVAESLR